MSIPWTKQRHGARRLAVTGLAVLFGSGCAHALPDASAPAPPEAEPHLLYSVSDFAPAARSVTLLPQPLHRTGGVDEAAGARLYVGGMASFVDGSPAPGRNRLALVILAANDSIRPMLYDFRQLLLDVDGELYRTTPIPDPRLYSFGRTGLGHTETVIVPIDRELLSMVVGAETVRGRIGHWLAFDIPAEALLRLGDLLTALPESFPSGERPVAVTPLYQVAF